MSDASQGEGWWEASDGKWYPPEQHPDVRQPAEPVDDPGPSGRSPTPTEPAAWGPPTGSMPPPTGSPYGPAPGAPPSDPPGGPPAPPSGGSNTTKWIIGGAVAAVIVAVAAFLLLRGGDDNNQSATATDSSDQSSDATDSTSSSSRSSSSSSTEFVDPSGVQARLLTATEIGTEFTDETFTPSTDLTNPCGDPTPRAVVPPTQDVGSTATEASRNLLFEEEVQFHKNAADNRKAFDVAVSNVRSCTDGTVVDSGSTSSFAVSDAKDVSSDLGVSKAVEFTLQTGNATVISVGVRLENCVASFTFGFPTSAGASAQPDELGITRDGLDKLLG